MSKESRRRQRQPARCRRAARPRIVPPSGGPAAPPTRVQRTARPSERAGRRDRARPLAKPSVFERYRTVILGRRRRGRARRWSAPGSSRPRRQPAYACSTIWEPAPTARPATARRRSPATSSRTWATATSPTGRKSPTRTARRRPGAHYNAAGRRPDPRRGSTARTTRSSRRAGSTTSSTAASWSCTRATRAPTEAAAAGPVRRRPAEPGLRLRARRAVARPGRRPLRRHGLAVRRARLGSRPAAPDARPAGHPRLLRRPSASGPTRRSCARGQRESAAPSSSAAPARRRVPHRPSRRRAAPSAAPSGSAAPAASPSAAPS